MLHENSGSVLGVGHTSFMVPINAGIISAYLTTKNKKILIVFLYSWPCAITFLCVYAIGYLPMILVLWCLAKLQVSRAIYNLNGDPTKWVTTICMSKETVKNSRKHLLCDRHVRPHSLLYILRLTDPDKGFSGPSERKK